MDNSFIEELTKMRQEFSREWISSTQVRKQRKYRYNAPLHLRHKMLSAHVHKSLRKEYGRSLPVRKGDEVKVVRGSFRGKTGEVTLVDLNKLKIYIGTMKRKKVSGQDVNVPIDPSNVVIIKPVMTDNERKKIATRRKR